MSCRSSLFVLTAACLLLAAPAASAVPPPDEDPGSVDLQARHESLRRRLAQSIDAIQACKQRQSKVIPLFLALRDLPPDLDVARVTVDFKDVAGTVSIEFGADADMALVEAARGQRAEGGHSAHVTQSRSGPPILVADLEPSPKGKARNADWNPSPSAPDPAPNDALAVKASDSPRTADPPPPDPPPEPQREPLTGLAAEVATLENHVREAEVIMPVSPAAARAAALQELCSVGFLAPAVEPGGMVPLRELLPTSVGAGPRAARFRATVHAGGQGWRTSLHQLTRSWLLIVLETVEVSDPLDPSSSVRMDFWIPVQPAWEELRPRPEPATQP